MNWQPIETAPKDRWILIWVEKDNTGKPGCALARWYLDALRINPVPFFQWGSFDGEFQRKHQPRFWMPLPEAPEEAK